MNRNKLSIPQRAILIFLLSSAMSFRSAEAQNTNLVLPPATSGLGQGIEGMNVPISFYGKVVDQDGNPLPGTIVLLRVQRPHFDPTYLAKAEYNHVKRVADKEGKFSLTDVTGKSVDLESISKSDYEPEPNASRFFGPNTGSETDPFLMALWKRGLMQNLVKGERKFHVVPDGKPYAIDLSSGTITQTSDSSGDLTLSLKMPAEIHGRDFAWSVEVRALNGGLFEEREPSSSMYRAPAQGYTNMITVSHKIGQRWERADRTLRFFLRLKDGSEYGRCSIDIGDYLRVPTPGPLYFDYAVNPSGSRILK